MGKASEEEISLNLENSACRFVTQQLERAVALGAKNPAVTFYASGRRNNALSSTGGTGCAGIGCHVNMTMLSTIDFEEPESDSGDDGSSTGGGGDDLELEVRKGLQFKHTGTRKSLHSLLTDVVNKEMPDFPRQFMEAGARKHLPKISQIPGPVLHLAISRWLHELDPVILAFVVCKIAAGLESKDSGKPCEECHEDDHGNPVCSRGCLYSLEKAWENPYRRLKDAAAQAKKNEKYMAHKDTDSSADTNSDEEEGGSDMWSVNEYGLLKELQATEGYQTSATTATVSTSPETTAPLSPMYYPSTITSNNTDTLGAYYNLRYPTKKKPVANKLRTIIRERLFNTTSAVNLLLENEKPVVKRNDTSYSDLSEGLGLGAKRLSLPKDDGDDDLGRYAQELSEASTGRLREIINDSNLISAMMETESCQQYAGVPFDEYYWVNKFAEINELTSRTEKADNVVEVAKQFCSLAEDFNKTAAMYARVIVCERHIDVRQKSIKPSGLGGVAGGEKFVCGGIVFKFAVDSNGLYGSDDLAAKAARHDLKGLDAIHHWVKLKKKTSIRLPLMVVMDYKGVTMVAVSKVPVGKNTLIYGSADGGHTCVNSDPEVNEMMAALGKSLNLKMHNVAGTPMALCGDIEVHRGLDGHLYMLDFARVFPPQPPSRSRVSVQESGRSSIFHSLMRSELVSIHEKPLCSDAFSLFDDSADRVDNCREAKLAYKRMILNQIPKFVAELEAESPIRDEASPFPITMNMHRYGINTRLLGVVHMCLKARYWRKIVLTEMAARSIKITVRRIIRSASKLFHGIPSEEPYRQVVVEVINALWASRGHSPLGKKLWLIVRAYMVLKFGENNSTRRFMDELHWGRLFLRVTEMLNISVIHSITESTFNNAEPCVAQTFISSMDITSVDMAMHGMFFVETGIGIQNYEMANKLDPADSRVRDHLETATARLNTVDEVIDPIKIPMKAYAPMRLAINIVENESRRVQTEKVLNPRYAEEADRKVMQVINRAHKLFFGNAMKFWRVTSDIMDNKNPDICYSPQIRKRVAAAWEIMSGMSVRLSIGRGGLTPHSSLFQDRTSADYRFFKRAFSLAQDVSKYYGEDNMCAVMKRWNMNVAGASLLASFPLVTQSGGHGDIFCMDGVLYSMGHLANLLVTGSAGGAVVLWSTENGLRKLTEVVYPSSGCVTAVKFYESMIVCGFYDGYVRLLGVEETGKSGDDRYRLVETNMVRAHHWQVQAVLALPNKLVVTAGADGLVRLFDLKATDPESLVLGDIHAHHGWATCLCHSGSLVFSGGGDGSVIVWDLEDLSEPPKVLAHPHGVRALAVCDDGCCLFVGVGRDIWMWKISSLTRERILHQHTDTVQSLNTAHGLLYSGGRDGVFYVWLQSTLKPISTLTDKHGPLGAAWCNGYQLYGAGPLGRVYMWDMDTMVFTSCIGMPNMEKASFCYTVHVVGNFIVCVTMNGIHVWDFESLNYAFQIPAGNGFNRVVQIDETSIVVHNPERIFHYSLVNQCEGLSVDVSEIIPRGFGFHPDSGEAFSAHAVKDGQMYMIYCHEKVPCVVVVDLKSLQVVRVKQTPDIRTRSRTCRILCNKFFVVATRTLLVYDCDSLELIESHSFRSKIHCIAVSPPKGLHTENCIVYVGLEDGLIELNMSNGNKFSLNASEPFHQLRICGPYMYSVSDNKMIRRWSLVTRTCECVVPETTIAGDIAVGEDYLVASRGIKPGEYVKEEVFLNNSSVARVFFFGSRYWSHKRTPAQRVKRQMTEVCSQQFRNDHRALTEQSASPESIVMMFMHQWYASGMDRQPLMILGVHNPVYIHIRTDPDLSNPRFVGVTRSEVPINSVSESVEKDDFGADLEVTENLSDDEPSPRESPGKSIEDKLALHSDEEESASTVMPGQVTIHEVVLFDIAFTAVNSVSMGMQYDSRNRVRMKSVEWIEAQCGMLYTACEVKQPLSTDMRSDGMDPGGVDGKRSLNLGFHSMDQYMVLTPIFNSLAARRDR